MILMEKYVNSELSFSQTSCPTKTRKPNLPYDFALVVGRKIWIHAFPQEHSC